MTNKCMHTDGNTAPLCFAVFPPVMLTFGIKKMQGNHGKIGDVHEICTFQPDGSAGFKKSMEKVQMSWTSRIFHIWRSNINRVPINTPWTASHAKLIAIGTNWIDTKEAVTANRIEVAVHLLAEEFRSADNLT